MKKIKFFFAFIFFVSLLYKPTVLLADDRILAPQGYKHIYVLRRGEYMPTRILYQGGIEKQKTAIEKEFTGPDGKIAEQVSREQVEKYVLKQFKLYAIKEISGKNGSSLSKEDQNAFIKTNRGTLRRVSSVMEHGIFTPYGRATDGTDKYSRVENRFGIP